MDREVSFWGSREWDIQTGVFIRYFTGCLQSLISACEIRNRQESLLGFEAEVVTFGGVDP